MALAVRGLAILHSSLSPRLLQTTPSVHLLPVRGIHTASKLKYRPISRQRDPLHSPLPASTQTWVELDPCSAATVAVSGECHMEEDIQRIITQIHDSPTRAVIYATGGSFQALTWLLTVPGASRTVLEARIPYAQQALTSLLGQAPTSYAAPETASAMAAKAYQDAANIAPFGAEFVGIGCSCALATDRPKKGDHKVVVATHSSRRWSCWELKLGKGARDRAGEDAVASRLLLRALAHAAGLPSDRVRLCLKEGIDSELQVSEEEVANPLQALADGRVRSVEYSGGTVVVDAPRSGRVYLPGSFNPLHRGHKRLLEAACKAAGGREGCFELAVGNADKGQLPLDDVRRRLQPFIEFGTPIVVTQAPLYTDKAKLFPGSVFAIGYDTAIRLVAPRYYGGEQGMLLAMAAIQGNGCKVLVAGRASGGRDSPFLTLADVEISDSLRQLEILQDIPEADFREDISSTELRAAAEAGPSAIHDGK